MHLKGLYAISDVLIEKESFSARIGFDPEHDIFKGHFPGQPVVPGVCLIHIAKEIANILSDGKVLLRKGTNMKFLQLVDPRITPVIYIHGTHSWNETGDMNITATITADDITFFKFKGIFS